MAVSTPPGANLPPLTPTTGITPTFRELTGAVIDGTPEYANRYTFDLGTHSWSETTGSDPSRTYIEASVDLRLTQFGHDIVGLSDNQIVNYVTTRFDEYPAGFDRGAASSLRAEVRAILDQQFGQLPHTVLRGRIDDWLGTELIGPDTLRVRFRGSWPSDTPGPGWGQQGVSLRFGGFSSHWTLATTVAVSSSPADIAFGPDNVYMAVGTSAGADVFNRSDWTKITLTSVARVCSFDPLGRVFSLVSAPDLVLRTYEYGTWTEYTNAQITGRYNSYTQIDYSADGQYVASYNGSGQAEIHTVGGNEAWTLAQTLTVPGADTRTLCWHPDGWLLLTDRTGALWLVDQATLTVVDSMTAANSPLADAYRSSAHPTQPWILVVEAGTHAVFNVSGGVITVETQWPGFVGGSGGALTHNWLYRSGGTADNEQVHQAGGTWPLDATLPYLQEVYGSDFSPDRNLLAFGGRSANEVVVYNTPPSTVPVSGTVTVDGTALQGAKITGINDTHDMVEDITTTAVDGTYTLQMTQGDTAHIVMEYDDGAGTRHNAKSKPFIVTA